MGDFGTGDPGLLNNSAVQLFESNQIASPVSGTVDFFLTVTSNTTTQTSRWDVFVLDGDVALVPEPSSAVMFMTALLGGVFLRRRR